MRHRKSRDRKIFRIEENPRLDFPKMKRHGRLVAAQDNIINQSSDAIQCGASAEDFELVNRFPAHERADQAAKSEDMIEVAMREQDAR